MDNLGKIGMFTMLMACALALAADAPEAAVTKTGYVPIGLIGHWDFNEGSGSVVHDRIGWIGDMKMNGGPKWTKNKSGYCMFFDNETGKGPVFLSMPDFSPFFRDISPDRRVGCEFTVAMWIKLVDAGYAIVPNSPRNFGCLFYATFLVGEKEIQFPVGGDNKMQLVYRLSAPKPKSGEWVHIAGSQDGVYARFYVNGELVRQPGGEAVTNALNPSGQSKSPWRFGLTSPWEETGRYRGYADEVKYYSRALSPEEVKKLYEESKPLID